MQHIIFDFDGTLVDSLPVAIAIARQVLPNFNLTDAEIARLRQLSAREVIKQSGIPSWQILRLLIKGKKLLGQHLDELKTFPGIDAMLKDLHQRGYQISVVSSNSEANIRSVLQREGVEDYFAGVYGNVGLFSKSRAFRVVLRDQKATPQQAIYVGDEVRDIEAGQRTGIKVVSVTWGYNAEATLKRSKPDVLAHNATELLTALTTHHPITGDKA